MRTWFIKQFGTVAREPNVEDENKQTVRQWEVRDKPGMAILFNCEILLSKGCIFSRVLLVS